MDSEAYQKMLKRIQNTDLNRGPEWRKARQAELDEIGLSTDKKYTSILFATGASSIFRPILAFRNLIWFADSKISQAQNVYKT
jgi:hypothetical protein